jgi:hypothetical protein
MIPSVAGNVGCRKQQSSAAVAPSPTGLGAMIRAHQVLTTNCQSWMALFSFLILIFTRRVLRFSSDKNPRHWPPRTGNRWQFGLHGRMAIVYNHRHRPRRGKFHPQVIRHQSPRSSLSSPHDPFFSTILQRVIPGALSVLSIVAI